MSRGLINILIVIIIGFLATPIPIHSEGIDLGLSFDNVSNVTVEDNSSTTVVDDSNEKFIFNGVINSNINPETLKIVIQSKDTELTNPESPEFIIDLVGKNKSSMEFSSTIFNYLGYNEVNSTYEYEIDISKEFFNAPSAFYKISLKSNRTDMKDLLIYEDNIQYLSSTMYIGSESGVPKNKMYIKLYLPTKDLKYLVPVSRIAPYSNIIIRRSMNGITEGANQNSGLYAEKYLPYASSLKFTADNITVKFNSRDLDMYKDNGKLSKIAIKSLLDTMTNITWLPEVKKINVLVDNKASDIYFDGYDLKSPLLKNESNKVYLPYETDEYMYLVPVDIESEGDIINDIFDMIKYSKSDFINLIPEDINLVSYFFEGDKLILNLSDNPCKTYQGRPDIENMIMDSILYSYGNLSNVSSIKINIANSDVSSIGNYDLNEYLTAPEYINIEK